MRARVISAFLVVVGATFLISDPSWAEGGGRGPDGAELTGDISSALLSYFAMAGALVTAMTALVLAIVKWVREFKMQEAREAEVAAEASPEIRAEFAQSNFERAPDLAPNNFEERLAAIERRFPSGRDEFAKYSTANEVILKGEISALSKQIVALEARILTKWDVLMIQIKIIGSLSGLFTIIMALIFSVNKYLVPSLEIWFSSSH